MNDPSADVFRISDSSTASDTHSQPLEDLFLLESLPPIFPLFSQHGTPQFLPAALLRTAGSRHLDKFEVSSPLSSATDGWGQGAAVRILVHTQHKRESGSRALVQRAPNTNYMYVYIYIFKRRNSSSEAV